MIEKETVLILGAGSNMAFGFPDGEKLKNEISLTIEKKSNKILNELVTPDLMNRFKRKLNYAPEYSIDEFLEHEEDEEIIELGKKAIVATLLKYEKENTIFYSPIKKIELENKFHLYRYLWKKINTSFEKFENNLSIITFNYDRSLEYYLYTALKEKYPGKKDDDYKKKLENIHIIHVYGKLGYLPWELPEDKKTVPYNYNWDKNKEHIDIMYEQKRFIVNASQSIKIVHQKQAVHEADKIKENLNYAKRIFFLGFGFNRINLERLISNVAFVNCEIRGTMYKMDPSDKDEARKIFKKFLPKRHFNWENQFPDATIEDFLYNQVTI